MEFFLVLQFILILICFFAIILLYLRQNRFRELEIRYQRMQKEMEDVISGFLLEIKEENERFLTKFEELRKKRDGDGNYDPPSAGEKNGVPPVTDLPLAVPYRMAEEAYNAGKAAAAGSIRASSPSEPKSGMPHAAPSPSESKNGKPPTEKNSAGEGEPENKEALLKRIEDLRKKGLTDEEIARKLRKGKTEVELLSKFYLNQSSPIPPDGTG